MDYLAECVFSSWSPKIGDPTIFGWATVWLYLMTGVFALRVRGRVSQNEHWGRERLFWGLTGLLLLALAVNKQLDLQSALTAIGRCISQAQGWYENRRAVQAEFILILGGVCIIGALTLLWAFRKVIARTWLAGCGLAFVVSFVMIRAVSFHHFDQLLKLDLGGARLNVVLEWTGPLLVIIAAMTYRPGAGRAA